MKKTGKSKNKKPLLKRRGIQILLIAIVLLVALRLALPYIVLSYANKTLSTMDGYTGKIKDIDIALYRGAYKIREMYLHKIDSVTQQETNFFEARTIDLSIHWEALFKGKIVGEVRFLDPKLLFTKDKAEPEEIKNDTTDFRNLINDFMPLRINRFEVTNGIIQYIDNNSSPKVDIQLNNAHIIGENLKTEKDTALLPATITADAEVYQGKLNLKMRFDPFSKQPTFDMNAELKDMNLPELNDFFKAYGKLDVNKGVFGLYTEIASKQGNFVGYVKPIIKDLDVVGAEDRKNNILQKMWEAFTGFAGEILENQKRDQVATKIPLKGNFNNTEADLWYAVLEVLKNAFIQALQPTIDQEINISTVNTVPVEEEEKKGLFKNLFDKKDSDKKNNKKTK
jgi:hypothetical protein